mgnify:CR=1 FL=1
MAQKNDKKIAFLCSYGNRIQNQYHVTQSLNNYIFGAGEHSLIHLKQTYDVTKHKLGAIFWISSSICEKIFANVQITSRTTKEAEFLFFRRCIMSKRASDMVDQLKFS